MSKSPVQRELDANKGDFYHAGCISDIFAFEQQQIIIDLRAELWKCRLNNMDAHRIDVLLNATDDYSF